MTKNREKEHRCQPPPGGFTHPYADLLKWTCPKWCCWRTWYWTPEKGWHQR